MSELDSAVKRAGAFDQQADAPADWEEVTKPEVGQVRPVEVDPMEAAENRAESLLRLAEGGVKLFIDARLYLDGDEIESGRQSLAPVIDKYNLAGEGTGRLPYQEEITAGLYLGGLFRRFKRAWDALRASDKAKAKKQQEQNDNGDQREHAATEPARAIPGDQRVREKPDPEAPGWSAENWGTGGDVGHEPRP